MIGLVLPLKFLPVDRVPLNGPVPVAAILRDTELPAQTVDGPLIVPVGLVSTLTVPVITGEALHVIPDATS